MKRSILITAAAAVGLASTASAQNPLAALGTLDDGVQGLFETSVSLVNGDVTATTNNLVNTVNGLTTGLAAGTPLAPFAESGVALSNTLVSLSPTVTNLLDAQAAPVADLAAPLSEAYVNNLSILRDGIPLAEGIIALGESSGGFQGLLVNSDIPVLSDILSEVPGLPGLDGSTLSLDSLPISADSLDPAVLTDLLSGASLPGLEDGLPGLDGLPGADALPGLDALPLDALDPAILTDALGGGLPGLDALPGADALDPAIVTDLLDPTILTGALDGGVPALPGALDALDPAIVTSLLDPTILTGALDGGLPALPGADALDPATLTDLLDPAILTDALDGGLPALPALPGA